jgi:hypothetical protein
MAASLTPAEVQSIHQAELAKGKSAKDARQGTRTLVHAELQVRNPAPYTELPTLVAAHLATTKVGLTPEHVAQIKAHQLSLVTEAEMVESERARSGVDSTHKDAHHFVQKKHGMALWAETDRLVGTVLGGAS